MDSEEFADKIGTRLNEVMQNGVDVKMSFMSHDPRQQGFVSRNVFFSIFRRIGLPVPESTIMALAEKFTYAHDRNIINYADFISYVGATAHRMQMMQSPYGQPTINHGNSMYSGTSPYIMNQVASSMPNFMPR